VTTLGRLSRATRAMLGTASPPRYRHRALRAGSAQNLYLAARSALRVDIGKAPSSAARG
jgi:hypothetical protein